MVVSGGVGIDRHLGLAILVGMGGGLAACANVFAVNIYAIRESTSGEQLVS